MQVLFFRGKSCKFSNFFLLAYYIDCEKLSINSFPPYYLTIRNNQSWLDSSSMSYNHIAFIKLLYFP